MIDSGVGLRMREFYAARNMLFKIHLDLLYACDLDCQHCYLDEKSAMKPASSDKIIAVLEQASELGAMDLLLSGGEIFLRKDLMTILTAARKLKYRVRLKTHGGRVTPEQVEQLVALGISAVDFSVYALDDEIHDAFTQRKGSLQRTLRGIDLIHGAGIHCEVKCSVTRVNQNHYQALHHFFTSRGIKVDFNAQIRKTNGAVFDPSPLNLSFDEKVTLNLFKIGLDGDVRDRPEPSQAPEETRLCFAGINALYVAPDLKVYPCSAFPMQVGDLTTQTLKEVWKGDEKLTDVRKMNRARTQGCSSCEARKYCGYCMGKSYLENDGDYTKPASITCADAFAWSDATQRYLAGERSPVQEAPKRQRKATFNIRSTHKPALPKKVTVCGNC